MPQSTIKVKSGNKYNVKFKVVGSLDDLTPEQLKAMALRFIRGGARAIVVANLNAAEPEVVTNRAMAEKMMKKFNLSLEDAKEFFAESGAPLEIPTTFEIPLGDLIPNEEGGRGKKAGNIFELESVDEDDEDEEAVTAEVAAVGAEAPKSE